MHQFRQKKALWGATIIALFLVTFVIPWRKALIVETTKEKRPLFCFLLEEGEEFVVYYTHSVNRRPVYDTLIFESDHFRVVRSRFDSFGAGIPSGEEGSRKLCKDDSGWILYELNYRIKEIPLFVAFTVSHGMIVRGKTIQFSDFVKPGTSLTLKPSILPLYLIWKKGCKG